jgi:tetratricopeptide (TPR) repeat protein
LARRGEVDAALKAFDQLLSRSGEDAALLAESGHWLRRAGRLEDADARLKRAASLDPQRAEIHLDMALLAVAKDDDVAALEAFEHALELRPSHNGTRIAFGTFLRRGGEFKRAVEVLEPATLAGGNDSRARAWTALGQAYAASGRGPEALAAFNRAVERAPALASAWARAARALVDLPQGDESEPSWTLEALEFARRGVRLAPQNSYVNDVLGIVAEANSLEDEAWKAYQKAAQLDPEARHARRRLIRLAIVREEWGFARSTAARLLELDGARAEYHFLSGLVESKAGEFAAARSAYERAIESAESPYAEAWYNLGLLERRAGRANEALHAYDRAVEIRPGYVAAVNNRGLVLRDLGRLDEAKASFAAAIELRSSHPSAWVNLARVESDLENFSASVAAYVRALELDPGLRYAALERAVNLRRAGRPDEAIEAYLDLVAAHPRYLKAWYNLGIAYAAAGQSDDAREAYESALALDASHWRSRKNLGLLELRLQREEAARRHLSEAADVHPEDVETRLALAELETRRGARAACRAHLEAVRAQELDLPEARDLVARCQ